MPIASRISDDKKRVSIEVSERFDYSLHQQFRDSYKDADSEGVSFELDLSRADYMDSSALGMILLLKEHADKCRGSVTITRPNEAVRKILDIANFSRFVSIQA